MNWSNRALIIRDVGFCRLAWLDEREARDGIFEALKREREVRTYRNGGEDKKAGRNNYCFRGVGGSP